MDRICNNGTSISDLQEQWPFRGLSFSPSSGSAPTSILVIDSHLTQALLNKGKRIVNFSKSQKTKLREFQCLC